MDGVAAGSAAHLGVLRLIHDRADRQRAEGRALGPSSAARRNRARQSRAGHSRLRVPRHAADGASVLDGDARRAAVASRQQHGRRAGRARRQRAMVERVHRHRPARWAGRFRPGSSASPPCSTTSARLPTARGDPRRFCGSAPSTCLLWLFLAGGILDRYARARPTRSHEFFTACGVYFVRFLRLAPFVALAYYVLFAVVHPLLFDEVYAELTRDVTVERTAFLIRLALYAVFGALLRARQRRLRLRQGARGRRRSPEHDRRGRRGRDDSSGETRRRSRRCIC